MTEADIPAFAAVDDAAMAPWAFARAMASPSGADTPRRAMVEGLLRASFANTAQQTYVKVTEAATGALVAAALWRFVLEPEPVSDPEDTALPTAGVVPRGSVGAGADRAAGRDRERAASTSNNDNVVEARVPPLMLEMRREWEGFRRECFAGQAYASAFVYTFFLGRVLLANVPNGLVSLTPNRRSPGSRHAP